jgi:hypothetical protein
LFVVSSALAFAPKVAKIVNVEALTVEEQNQVCLYKLVPQAPISINSSSKLHLAMVGS